MKTPKLPKKIKRMPYDGTSEQVFTLISTRADRLGNVWGTYRTDPKPVMQDGVCVGDRQYTHEVHIPADPGFPPPRTTQDYAKLGDELWILMNLINEYYCTLPNGTEGFLLPRDPIMKLRAYIPWVASQFRPRGRNKISPLKQIGEVMRLRDEVKREQEKRGCSQTEALQQVYRKLGKQSWRALEKEISPSRLKAAFKALEDYREREKREVDALWEKMERVRRQRVR